MHVAGKVFLGLGALLLVLGLVMAYSGGNALEDVGDVDVEGRLFGVDKKASSRMTEWIR